jgi:aminopeptidase YwaD
MRFRRTRYFLPFTCFLLLGIFTHAQCPAYARHILDKLASESMHGRGYVKNGEGKAAKYISKQFYSMGLKPMTDDYFQPFKMPINTFPGKITLSVDGLKLEPGTEFLIASSSPSVDGTFDLVWMASDTLPEGFDRESLKDKFVIFKGDIRKLCLENPFGSAGIIIPVKPEDNLWWHVSNGTRVREHTLLVIRDNKLDTSSKQITLKAFNKFIPDYQVRNVAGYVEGSVCPDSFLVVTAHYDHLGMMGKNVYFPGANDNASGTAMLLDLVRHYLLPENRQPYSMLFIACAAEETGLQGSTFFAENPLIPLKKIRFLVNLDMVGTGSEGITVVNATLYEKEFKMMQDINEEKHYLPEVASRGESCNSDHCPFFKKGVPAVFIYTRGKEFQEYHNVKDRAENLPLTAYDSLFRLLTDFFSKLQS